MKTQNKQKVHKVFLGLLSLALLGTILQSFAINNNDLAPKAMSSYEVTEITTYSFDCVENVPERELLKAQKKVKNKRIEISVDSKNSATCILTNLDQPRSAHDLEHLVSQVVYSSTGVQMFDYNGRAISKPNGNTKSDFNLTFSNDQIARLGLSPILRPPSGKEMDDLTKSGKSISMHKDGSYVVSGGDTEMYVFPSDGVVEIKHFDAKTKQEQKITTFYKPIFNDASIKVASITERSERLPSGVTRTEKIKTLFKNNYITHEGKVTLDLRNSSGGNHGGKM